MRRMGGGRYLLTEVLKQLFADGTESLYLTVRVTNEPVIALYRGLGFKNLQTVAAFKTPVVSV